MLSLLLLVNIDMYVSIAMLIRLDVNCEGRQRCIRCAICRVCIHVYMVLYPAAFLGIKINDCMRFETLLLLQLPDLKLVSRHASFCSIMMMLFV